MLIKFILTFVASMCQKIIQNVNLLQSFLLIRYLYTKTNITCKYIKTIVLKKIIDERMIDYLSENPFETDEN